MRYTVNLRDQPTEYLEQLAEDLAAEIKFRKFSPSEVIRSQPHCCGCGHTGHNIMTCGGRGFSRKGEDCDCGRSDCPQPEEEAA